MTSIKPQSNNLLILQKFILDPLSTIIKLAILGKKSIGCKISIRYNQIYIQESGVFQGVTRYYMGNTKNDIHYLSIPIDIACKRYLTIEKIKEIPNIITIFKCAQQGLNNLMETYITFPIVVHCLKYYYSIIDTHIHLIKCNRSESFLENNLDKKNNIKIFNTPELIYKVPAKKNKDKLLYNHHSYQFNNKLLTQNIDAWKDENDALGEDLTKLETVKIEDSIKNETEIIKSDIDTIDSHGTNNNEDELLLLYDDELLNKLDLIWEKSKILIVINMIDYLIGEKSAAEYAGCIETFMIPIDKESLNIISNYKKVYENPNITSE